MRNDKIAVIGDKDSILAFKAVGADVYPIKNTFDAADTLKKLARSYAVIFITEEIAEEIEDVVNRYKARPYPAVIPIPGAKGTDGFGMKGISKNVEKALGTDILK
ncbi:MAG: V-type ATP synthase subunit F [Clostridia bacterium]|nr:V-type ATP synthase subunit F [Clostridia bacterium]